MTEGCGLNKSFESLTVYKDTSGLVALLVAVYTISQHILNIHSCNLPAMFLKSYHGHCQMHNYNADAVFGHNNIKHISHISRRRRDKLHEKLHVA